MTDERGTDHEPARDDAERRDAALDRSGLNPNVVGEADPDPTAERPSKRSSAPPPVDPDSPGASVDDTTSPEAVEPNEPG